jgi:hypothetical protein
MAQLIFHTGEDAHERVENERFLKNAAKTREERMKYAFQLMELSQLFKKGPIKSPEGKGIVLRKSK